MNAGEPTTDLDRLSWEMAPVPALLCSPDGRCLDINRSAGSFLGKSLEEIRKCQLSDFAVHDDLSILEQMIKKCDVREHAGTPELMGIKSSKGQVQCLVNVRSLSPEFSNKLLIQIQEIPPDLHAAKSNSESKLHYTDDAIFVFDINDRIQFWNSGSRRLFGWEEKEILGLTVTESVFSNTPNIVPLLKSLRQAEHWSGELGAVTKTGEHRNLETRFNLLKDGEGRLEGILAIVVDITEKRAVEECYVRSQRLESLSTLAAGVAHDLNNVFTPITMAVELLRNVDLPPDEMEDLLRTVDGSIERGTAIIKQLVAFGKGAEGENIVFQPKHLVREVVNIVQKTFPQGIEVKSEILRELWVIRGDQIQFHQLLMNLFLNAKDAMPQGGALHLRAQNVTIDEHFPSFDIDLDPGRYVQLTIEDDGEGMDKAVQEKMFEPFFTTRPVGRGSGLGLTNVLGIVKSFNGFIQCQSRPGEGTKFDVFIPAIFEDEPKHLEYNPADHRGNGETILIVDDEEAVRDTTQKLLVQNGYKTLKAVDGVDAVSVFGRNQGLIKLVLTDLKMPNMDGISLVRILRNMNHDLPILVVSGHPDEHDIEMLTPCASIHVLEKPHKSADLLHWVHRLLCKDQVPM